MKDMIVWLIHTPAGTLALVTAVVAMLAQKGSSLHRKAGACFTWSMMIMLISGIAAAYLKDSIDDMMLGALVTYTVFTAWLTAHHKQKQTNYLELIALVWILGLAAIAFLISTGWLPVQAPAAYLFWAGFAILCALGDFRNLVHSGLAGKQRIIRHVWRVGFSLLWAALAFIDKIVKILGANMKNMQDEKLLVIVAVPTVLILGTVLYWIAKVMFFSCKTYANYDSPLVPK